MTKIPFSKTAGEVNVKERLRILNRKQRHAVLATDADGQPYTSLVAFALTPGMQGALFATPRKTTKYRNILSNRHVSLMIDSRSNSAKGYMKSEAVTVLGTASAVRKGRNRDELAALFIKKHPQLSGFVKASTTALIFVSFQKVIHAGQFQTVTVWEPQKT
jgi:nitroimidazol reductase NimA-like FMN-containing flavoprotein (pyridoxamine 5'-phosphate oxidase superfamily)